MSNRHVFAQRTVTPAIKSDFLSISSQFSSISKSDINTSFFNLIRFTLLNGTNGAT